MPTQAQRRARERRALVVLALVLLTFGAFVVNDKALKSDLVHDSNIAAFEKERQLLERSLRTLQTTPPTDGRPAEIRERWQTVQDQARTLAVSLNAPAAIELVELAEGAIEQRISLSGVPGLAGHADTDVFAHLADIAMLLDMAALEMRTEALARYRTLTGLTLLLLTLEGLWLLLPSMNRLARVETAAKEAEDKLAYLAHHDELTGLANRRALEGRLDELVTKPNQAFGIILCDLDGFKPINDLYGHDAGDAVLKAVARRLEHGLRPGDMPVRLGGDEFVLVVADAPDGRTLASVAERLREQLAHPVRFGPHQLRFAASLGTALFPDDGANPRALISAADAAMYEAKQAGGREVRSYSLQLRERDTMRHEIAHELEAAIGENALSIALQPRVEVESGRISGFEALTRWHSRTRGEVPPKLFIPMAESAGLLTPLTCWMLDEVERVLSTWERAGLGTVPVSVNISGAWLLGDDALDALTRFGPGRIGVEINENMLFGRNAEATLASIERLHERGVSIAIDDFGTGSTSLGRLARIPFDYLKISGSFVRQVDERPTAAAVVRTVIELAQRLGGRAVATNVETHAQFDFLSDHGCDEVQGFIVAPPLSSDVAARYLARGQDVSHEIS